MGAEEGEGWSHKKRGTKLHEQNTLMTTLSLRG